MRYVKPEHFRTIIKWRGCGSLQGTFRRMDSSRVMPAFLHIPHYIISRIIITTSRHTTLTTLKSLNWTKFGGYITAIILCAMLPSLMPTILTIAVLVGDYALAAQICGSIGTHNYSTIAFYMGNFFFKAPATFALCSDFCKNDSPRCKSFRYSYYADADSQYCEFFDQWL